MNKEKEIYVKRLKESVKLLLECKSCVYSLIDLIEDEVVKSMLIKSYDSLTHTQYLVELLQNDSFIKNCFVYGNNCEK